MIEAVVISVVLVTCLGGVIASLVSDMALRLCRCVFIKFNVSNRASKIFYVVLVSVNVFGAQALRRSDVLSGPLKRWNLPPYAGCSGDPLCVDSQLAYRCSFAMSVFFLFMFSLLFFDTETAHKAHVAAAGLKLVAVPLMAFASIWVSNDLFALYASFATYTSLAFLVIQLVIIIDVAYSWNEAWVANSEETDNLWWLAGLIAVSVIFLVVALALTFCVFMSPSNWWATKCLMGSALIVGLILTAVSITELVPHGALFTSSAVLAFSILQLWSAVSSPVDINTSDFRPVIATITAFGALLYNCFTLSAQPDVFHCSSEVPFAASRVRSAINDSGESRQMIRSPNPTMRSPRGSVSSPLPLLFGLGELRRFYAVLLAFSLYAAMLCTNWGTIYKRTQEADGSIVVTAETPAPSFWVQVTGGCLSLVLYGWTLVAPKLLPNRRF